ncbi:hypothetical protein LTR28_006519, partial [Elasticomyces elasticus]
MDFSKLQRQLPKAGPMAQNGTQPMALTDLPVNILEALIPGYSVISRYILAFTGFDISLLVSIAALLFAFSKGGRYLAIQLESGFRAYLMSSVYIDDGDDLFESLMSWIAEQRMSRTARNVKAKTQRGSAWDEADDLEDTTAGDAVDENGIFNFNKWSARIPPRYEPYYGAHRFWFRRRLFVFKRSHKPVTNQVNVQFGSSRDEDLVQLSCVGRSTAPIKDLLRHIKVWALDKTKSKTVIRRPTPKDRARYAGHWSKTSSRPSRPMDTVILDAEQKARVQADVNEYLHPLSPRWYADRGIPYRRGYLFYGAPGTGKTSLSFALAGIFGLEIYVISLQEPSLTEGDLGLLFNSLPRRCIVLLEDIDSAGLLRDGKSDEEEQGAKERKTKNVEGKTEEKKGTDEKSGDKKDENKDVKGGKDEKKTDEDEKPWTLQDLAKAL